MPFLPIAFTLASAAVSDAQSLMLGHVHTGSLQDSLVVVQGQRVGADRHAVGLAVD